MARQTFSEFKTYRNRLKYSAQAYSKAQQEYYEWKRKEEFAKTKRKAAYTKMKRIEQGHRSASTAINTFINRYSRSP